MKGNSFAYIAVVPATTPQLFTATQMTNENADSFLPAARAMLPELDVVDFGFGGAGGRHADQQTTPADPFDDALLSRKRLNEATMAAAAAGVTKTMTSKYFKKKQKTTHIGAVI